MGPVVNPPQHEKLLAAKEATTASADTKEALKHGLTCRNGAALGSRTPDLRITSNFVTGYAVHSSSIPARRVGHGARLTMSHCLRFVPRLVPRRTSTAPRDHRPYRTSLISERCRVWAEPDIGL